MLHSTGSQSVRRDWVTEQQHSTLWFCEFVILRFYTEIIILQLLLSLPCSLVYVFLHIPAPRFFFKLLEHSCFTMSCQHLLNSKVYQLSVYILLLFRLPSHLVHHRALSRVPCATQRVLISYLLYIQQGTNVNPNLPIQIPYPIHNPLELRQNMDAHNLWQHSTLSQKFQVMQQSWKNFGKHYKS